MNTLIPIFSPNSLNPAMMLAASIICFSILGCLLLWLGLFRKLKQLQRHQRSELHTLTSLCKHLIGLDQKITTLQKPSNELPTQATLAPSDRAMRYAIQLLQAGTAVDEVATSCGLSFGEVEVLQTLHGRN